MSHLRFTPEELRAVQQACQPLELRVSSFTAFQSFLVESLVGALPCLAWRLALLPARRLGILLKYLRARRPSPTRGHRPPRDETAGGLTFKEWQAVRQASDLFFLYDGSLCSFQDYLVFNLREMSPGLANKLARLSRQQIAKLYHAVSKRSWGMA